MRNLTLGSLGSSIKNDRFVFGSTSYSNKPHEKSKNLRQVILGLYLC